MRIRPLTTLEECRRVAELERVVWGYTDAEDVVPPPVLIVTIRLGGLLLGAFNEAEEMMGFVYSLPGLKNGRILQWSHMLGVVPEARHKGIGERLKLAQRKAALAMGIEVIEWTYDPLQAVNAHLNFARLGVVAEEYEENIYGESSSPLHRGTPTDRLIAEWHLTKPHVGRRAAASYGPPQPVLRDASVSLAPVINPSEPGDPWIRPGRVDPALQAPHLLVEIPTDFSGMQSRDPELALAWRLHTREIFQTYFRRRYRAVDFFLAPERSRGHYLLTTI